MNDQMHSEELSQQQGDLLVITVPQVLSMDQRERAIALAELQAERLGCRALLLDGGANAQLQPSTAELLAEMQKQTALLEQIATGQLALIEALADDESEDPDAPPRTYLDGTPCR